MQAALLFLLVMRNVTSILLVLWRKRAQSARRQQVRGHNVQNGAPVRSIQHGVAQRKRQKLIRAETAIVAIIAINYIIQLATRGIPETLVEIPATVLPQLLIFIDSRP